MLTELNHLEKVLQEELLTDLTGKSPFDLQKDLQIKSVSRKVGFLYEIVDCLQGAYNEEGIRRWFQRERTRLERKTPLEYLGNSWNPNDERAKEVLRLAQSLRYMGGT